MKYGGAGAGGLDGENEDLYILSGSSAAMMLAGGMITSDGKAIGKKPWGLLPCAFGGGGGLGNGDNDDDNDGGGGIVVIRGGVIERRRRR